MRPLRALRAMIVPVPALVDRKADAVRKMDAALGVGAARKTDAVLKMDAVPKMDAGLKTGAVQKVDAVPDDVRSQEWSLLSVRQFPAARLTRLGSRLQAFQFGRLRRQNPDHVAVLVAKAPTVPVAVPVAPADLVVLLVPAVPAAARPHVVIANFATCANRGRHTSKFFTSSACFSM